MSRKSTSIVGCSKPHSNSANPYKPSVPVQIARLKKEDEEDSWISGEELYTEGSSDEENSEHKFQQRSRTRESAAVEEAYSQPSCSSQLTGTQKKRLKTDEWRPPKSISATDSASDDEKISVKSFLSSEDDDELTLRDNQIFWKPKRGRGSLQCSSRDFRGEDEPL